MLALSADKLENRHACVSEAEVANRRPMGDLVLECALAGIQRTPPVAGRLNQANGLEISEGLVEGVVPFRAREACRENCLGAEDGRGDLQILHSSAAWRSRTCSLPGPCPPVHDRTTGRNPSAASGRGSRVAVDGHAIGPLASPRLSPASKRRTSDSRTRQPALSLARLMPRNLSDRSHLWALSGLSRKRSAASDTVSSGQTSYSQLKPAASRRSSLFPQACRPATFQ